MAEVNTGNTHPPNILGFQLIFSGVGGFAPTKLYLKNPTVKVTRS